MKAFLFYLLKYSVWRTLILVLAIILSTSCLGEDNEECIQRNYTDINRAGHTDISQSEGRNE